MVERMEVHTTYRNPDDYPQIYWEGRGMNKNTFL